MGLTAAEEKQYRDAKAAMKDSQKAGKKAPVETVELFLTLKKKKEEGDGAVSSYFVIKSS